MAEKEEKKEDVKKETKNEKVEKKVEKKNEAKKEEKPKTEKKAEKVKAEKKTESKKNSNIFVKILSVIIILVVVALLTYMIITSSDPKKSVDGFLTNLKAGDFEKAQEYSTGERIVEEDDFSQEAQKLLFDKLEWKVEKIEKEDENNAKVEVEITNKDFKSIISNYVQKIISSELSGNSDSDIEKGITEELKSENVQTTTKNGTIKLFKDNKIWKVVVDDELSNTLLPGLEEAME